MARLEDAPPAVAGLAAGANAAAEDMPASKRALLPRESLMVVCSSTQWEWTAVVVCPSSSPVAHLCRVSRKHMSLFLFSVTIGTAENASPQ